jgi:hypothetical protein
MPVVRIVAKYVDEGVVDDENKFFLLASINKENRIISGEWLGYFITDGRKHPFIMDHKGTLWYDQSDDMESEDTNLLSKPILLSEYFSFNIESEEEVTYKIIAVNELP